MAEQLHVEWGNAIYEQPDLFRGRETLIRHINTTLVTTQARLLGWEWEVGGNDLYLIFNNGSEIAVPIYWADSHTREHIRRLSFDERLFFENLLERLQPTKDPRDWSPHLRRPQ